MQLTTLYIHMIYSSLYVVISSDVAANSSNPVAPFCDVSEDMSHRRCGFKKHSYRTKELMRTFDEEYVTRNDRIKQA